MSKRQPVACILIKAAVTLFLNYVAFFCLMISNLKVREQMWNQAEYGQYIAADVEGYEKLFQ